MSANCVIMVCLTSPKVFKRYSRTIFEHFEQLPCCKKRKIFLEQLWSSFLLLSVAAPFRWRCALLPYTRSNVNSAMPTCTQIAVQRKCAIPVQQKTSFCALKSYYYMQQSTFYASLPWFIGVLEIYYMYCLFVVRLEWHTPRLPHVVLLIDIGHATKWSFCHGFIKTEMNSSLYES